MSGSQVSRFNVSRHCDHHKWVGVFLLFKNAVRHSVMPRTALHNKELSGLKY